MERNKIHNMDCVQGMRMIEDNSIDLTVTSPPYDNLRGYDEYEWNFDETARELWRITKDGGVVVWVVGDQTINGSESCTSFKQALHFREIGFNLYDTEIYQKANYTPLTHRRYEQSFEYMFIFSKGRPKTFNPIMVPCKNAGKIESYGSNRRKQIDKNQAMRSPEGTFYKATKSEKIHPNIFTYSCGGEKTGHPAAFPNQLAEDHIKTWSNPGDLILDPFAGSGTTLVQARKNGREYIGFEISEKYCEIIEARLKEEYHQISFV